MTKENGDGVEVARAMPTAPTPAPNRSTHADNGKAVEFSAMTGRELLEAKFPVDYLVDGILAAGQPCVVGGPHKCLKTSLVLDLAVALSVGGKFLRKFDVPRAARVAVMSGESGMAAIQSTVRRIAKAADYGPERLENVLIAEQVPRVGEFEQMEALATFVTDNEVEVLCIDPAYLAMPNSDPGNIFAVGEQLRLLNVLIAQTGCTLIMVHHSVKRRGMGRDQFAPVELADLAWAGWCEWARQWVLVGRREAYDPGSADPHRLWLTTGGSAGHGGRWALTVDEGARDSDRGRYWDVEVSPGAEARREADRRKEADKEARDREKVDGNKRKIVEALVKYPDGETKTTVRDSAGLRSGPFGAAFAELLRDGTVVSCKVQKGNRKSGYDGYKLVDDDLL